MWCVLPQPLMLARSLKIDLLIIKNQNKVGNVVVIGVIYSFGLCLMRIGLPFWVCLDQISQTVLMGNCCGSLYWICYIARGCWPFHEYIGNLRRLIVYGFCVLEIKRTLFVEREKHFIYATYIYKLFMFEKCGWFTGNAYFELNLPNIFVIGIAKSKNLKIYASF